jgi:radical SAM superfamily enzyme YgiQ (UPF0313 family)
MPLDVMLISPPLWDPYAPAAANPALLGFLRARGFRAAQLDLNQAYFADRFDSVLAGALADTGNADTLAARVPAEHRVVLGLVEPDPHLLGTWGIPDEALSVAGFRQAIATWDRLDVLNAMDALVHYGYFVRKEPAWDGLLTDEAALEDPAWRSLRRIVERDLLPRLAALNPTVVGLSILGEQQHPASVAVTAWIRQAGLDPFIVWGGSQIRALHSMTSQDTAWWRRLPDAIVLGEGETAISRLASRAREAREAVGPGWAARLRFGRRPTDETFVPGLIAQPLEQTLVAPKRYEDPAELVAYDFDGLDLAEGYLMPWPTIPFQGSRGCHWGLCGFCDHEEGYRLHYRPKEAEQVVDNLEHYRDVFGVRHIQFVDEAIEPAWLRELTGELDRRGLRGELRWSNYSKVSADLDADLLATSYANGCRLILFGVESFNQRVLNVVKKGIRRDEILSTLHATHEAGIRSWIWLIAGLPTQTVAELEGDIADLRSLVGVVDAASVGRYRISENSDIYRKMQKFGIVHADLGHPMDVRYESGGQPVDPAAVARLYYEEYYPAAIAMSVTHNRYLLFADALKRERPGSRPHPPRPAAAVRVPAAVSTSEVVGNI